MELEEAERKVLRAMQREAYGELVMTLERGLPVPRSSSVFRLEPYVDKEGMLRVGGRLQRATIGSDARNPYLLPRNHAVTTLIVRYVHRVMAGHMGREQTVAALRERFWVPGVHVTVDRELRRCITCRRQNWQVRHQREADLPAERLQAGETPFTATGLDCFGPINVALGRKRVKRWGCLFTCLACRAIHLEVLAALDASELLMALTRFTSRRGVTPKLLRSDNGTNMVRASKDIAEAIRGWDSNHSLQSELAARRIEWRFNAPGAPHAGGVWERQIRTVKRALRNLIGEQVLDDSRLNTLFCEVERVVNNRPLTAIPNEPGELEALTPAHVLFARGDPGPFLGSWSAEECFRRKWRHAQLLADQFWRRWTKEYLPSLRKRQKEIWSRPNLKVGDVVLVTDIETSRNRWPLARVTGVITDDDGIVRRVKLRTASKSLTRATAHLCLLEGVSE